MGIPETNIDRAHLERHAGRHPVRVPGLRSWTVRVNIVGFAIEDPKLAVTFSHWASLGNGSYFDAKDAAGLSNALTQSMRARLLPQ